MMRALRKLWALVQLALSGPAKLTREQDGTVETLPVPVRKRKQVFMEAPGALVQVTSVPEGSTPGQHYEGPLDLARRRSVDPKAVP
jgi:hypothetical protein